MDARDLERTLADATIAGACDLDPRTRQALAGAAARLGFAYAAIDLSGCGDRRTALWRIARALDFPDWFGGNWDALSDCLADLSWRPARGYVFVLDHAQDWRRAEPDAFDVLMEIAREAASAWAARGIPFWLLVAAPPAAGAP